MNVTQLTHHDLDGYGASTLVGAVLDVARIVHIPRYSDVGPVVEAELKRLDKAPAPELLIMTDLGLEAVAVKFIRSFAALNRRRQEDARHRLVVLDHHASSIDQLRDQGLEPVADPEIPTLRRFELGDPNIAILIDEGRCATRMAYEHRNLYATRPVPAEADAELQALVAAVDALDLWKKERPAFAGGLALDEVFWDNVGTLVPVGHPWHDRFVGMLLRAVAGLLREGATPARVEAQVGAIRVGIVDTFMADDPADDPALTTRMRIARALARSDALFHRLSDGTLLSFGLDSGTFQRVSDLIMVSGRARRVVNVQRVGTLSFRSNDETALEGARRFRGGGHKDAAGGKLTGGSAFSLADAVAQVEPILNPPPPDPATSPFAALKNWKG
ncbi:dimethylmenaquinone methyltransferase [Methylobacterium planeticum]|uniref:Dimethylmenaquinone methyltransferase n=1 Tax=Methylobacterium planeticum TaxID=2615211 RepID=A0A6N6MW15_9HYPH|nr:dimethylmenaquinone methyltransferase [Methylobacterium planeticum]KAB1073170.1 dimethylmenaquinone methyltransferase [Methylobacterium planeticum]